MNVNYLILNHKAQRTNGLQGCSKMPSKEIKNFKVSHESKPEDENSLDDSIMVVFLESTYRSDDVRVDSHTCLSSSSSPSSSSSSPNGERAIEFAGRESSKIKYCRRKRERDGDYNDDEKSDKPDVGISAGTKSETIFMELYTEMKVWYKCVIQKDPENFIKKKIPHLEEERLNQKKQRIEVEFGKVARK